MFCSIKFEPAPNKAKEGFDIVLGKDGYLTDTKTNNIIGAFRIMSRGVVDNFYLMKEYNLFCGGMIGWLGFKTAYTNVMYSERVSGKTFYALNKLINLALNAAGSFSDKPLRIAIKFGFVLTS